MSRTRSSRVISGANFIRSLRERRAAPRVRLSIGRNSKSRTGAAANEGRRSKSGGEKRARSVYIRYAGACAGKSARACVYTSRLQAQSRGERRRGSAGCTVVAYLRSPARTSANSLACTPAAPHRPSMAEPKEHYVHFSSASGAGCNNIVVQPLRHGHLNVNLGFLQIYHRYHVEFTVPWNTCVEHPEEKPKELAKSIEKPNSNCQVVSFLQDKNDDLRLKVELLAKTERFLKEEFQIKCCDKGEPLTIYLNARIFGKDQGTPVLRNGIRCVAVEKTEEEDEDDTEKDEDDEDTEKEKKETSTKRA